MLCVVGLRFVFFCGRSAAGVAGAAGAALRARHQIRPLREMDGNGEDVGFQHENLTERSHQNEKYAQRLCKKHCLKILRNLHI